MQIINKTITGYKMRKREGNVKGAVIHNDASTMTALEWYHSLVNAEYARLKNGIAHYYGDSKTMWRAIDTFCEAWHTANAEGNYYYLGYEAANSMGASDEEFIENEEAVFRQVAIDFNFYGLKPNRSTIRLHNEFSATACPHRSMLIHTGVNPIKINPNQEAKNKLKDYFIARVQWHMDQLQKENIAQSTVKPTPKPPSKKSNEVIAKEVIAGKWGVGNDRKQRLTRAGYNYDTIQNIVNNLISKPKPITKKSNEVIAKEVISGKWGNDPQRSQKLRAAGYNPNAIQSLVNRML